MSHLNQLIFKRKAKRLHNADEPNLDRSDVVRLMRFLGPLGCLGSFVVLVADLLMLGGPLPPDMPNVMHLVPSKPEWIVFWGHTLGVLFIPLCLSGIVLFWVGLRPAGFWPATLISAGLATLFAVGPFVHGMYAPLGSLLAFEDNMSTGTYSALLERMTTLFTVPTLAAIALFMAASLAFSIVVLRGHSFFPKWLGLWSPGPMMALFVFSTLYLPPWAAGIISPACVHVAYLPLISFITWWLWDLAAVSTEERRAAT